MRVLGIESSSSRSGVAVIDADGSSTESVFEHHQGLLINLAPTIQSLVRTENAPPVDGISVSIGPGSFTGLRIGVATAKALAYAWNVSTVGVPTMDALLRTVEDAVQVQDCGIDSYSPPYEGGGRGRCSSSAQTVAFHGEDDGARKAPPHSPPLVKGGEHIGLMIRSRRGEVFGAISEDRADGARVLSDVVCVTVDEFLETLAGHGASSIVIAGDAAALYRESILRAIPDAIFVREEANFPSPVHVARIGMERLLRGELDDPVALAPRYHRRTYVGTE